MFNEEVDFRVTDGQIQIVADTLKERLSFCNERKRLSMSGVITARRKVMHGERLKSYVFASLRDYEKPEDFCTEAAVWIDSNLEDWLK